MAALKKSIPTPKNGKTTAEDKAAFEYFCQFSTAPPIPQPSSKAPNPIISNQLAAQTIQYLQVVHPVSRFVNVTTIQSISSDLLDLQIDTAKQDLAGQKKITDASFNGMETPHMFREDMRTDSLARRKWLCLLFVQDAKGDKVNILDNYMRISAVDTQES